MCAPNCKVKEFDKMEKKDYQFIVTNAQLSAWHLFADNPTCVQKVINKAYWDAYNKLHLGDGLWIFLVIGIAVGLVLSGVIIIIIFWVSRGDRTQTDYVRNHYLKQGYIMVRRAAY